MAFWNPGALSADTDVSGTTGRLAKFTAATAVGNSSIAETGDVAGTYFYNINVTEPVQIQPATAGAGVNGYDYYDAAGAGGTGNTNGGDRWVDAGEKSGSGHKGDLYLGSGTTRFVYLGLSLKFDNDTLTLTTNGTGNIPITLNGSTGIFNTPSGVFTHYGNVATSGSPTYNWTGSTYTIASTGVLTLNGTSILIGTNTASFTGVAQALSTFQVMTAGNADASAGTTTRDSGNFKLSGKYWNGSASVIYGFRAFFDVTATTPAGKLSLMFGTSGSEAEKLSIDQDGIIAWIAGNAQTTVGAAGAAAAVPANPTRYLKVRDSDGTLLVIPAFLAA